MGGRGRFVDPFCGCGGIHLKVRKDEARKGVVGGEIYRISLRYAKAVCRKRKKILMM